jgi:uncharacterized protein (TIGR02996 family)
MSEREAFIESIAAQPDEDTPRLAFADWLQEHGEEDRAEYVRLSCALARRPPSRDGLDRGSTLALLARNFPEWFGDLFTAAGMPRPTGKRGASAHLGAWRYGPYALHHAPRLDPTEWEEEPRAAAGDGLFVRFAAEFRGDRRAAPAHRPPRFLNYLGLTRGFVTCLRVNPAESTVWKPLARLFRIEPVHELTIDLDAEPNHWLGVTDPCLRRVRTLQITLFFEEATVPDFSRSLGAVLDDPVLTGTRELSLVGPFPRTPPADDEYEPPERFAPAALIEQVLQTPVANAVNRLQLSVGRAGALAFAGGAALSNLRSLELIENSLGPSDTLALNQYRDRLERLGLSEDALDLGPFIVGRPWERLTRLRAPTAAIGPREWEALARSDVFPALTQLSFMGWAGRRDDVAASVIGAFRAGGFAALEHLDLSGNQFSTESMLALASAVAPTRLRRLVFGTPFDLSEWDRERIDELLGDRVQIPPNEDSIPF